MTGVMKRATISEKITAIATVRPNWLKYWPAMPPMKLTGAKIATIDSEIAMTARPISSAASSEARNADLPIRMWRTMFSISTIASSTRMPVTSVIASRLTRLSEKPIASIIQKVGMMESGIAMAVTMVARKIAQEDEHHDDREQRALDQGLHRRVIIAEFVVDLGVDLGEFDLGMRGLDLREPRRDHLVDGDVARALGARHAEGDDRLVKQPRKSARLGGAVGDRAEFVEPDLAPARQRDRQRGEIGDRTGAGERADRLLLARDLAAAAAEIDVVGAHLLVDGRGGDAEREQFFGIERDADLAIDAAEALDLADASNALQVTRDRVVDEPGKLLGRHAGRASRVGDDRQALDVDAADHRLVDRCAADRS